MTPSHPHVTAVVVSHNGRPFLRDTLRGLADQTRPIDDILVVDTGSTDGSADWLRSRLGPEAVLQVRGQFGRAVMAAVRDPRTAGSDWYWLLHDDAAPEPEALERLLAVAESYPTACVLGPKLVHWSDPRRLQEVGWMVDRTGRPVPIIEEDEIDQGQRDQVRDVFFVNTAGMLVRRTALLAAGGFDERMPAFGDDLDLCWRMRLLGGRVLVVPTARVRHFAGASLRSRRTRHLSFPRYLRERHTFATLLKCASLKRLPGLVLLAAAGSVLRTLGLALTGRPGDAAQVLWAWGWNLKELPITLVHRRRLQQRRRVGDAALAALRAPGGQHLRTLTRNVLEFVASDAGEHAAQPITTSDDELEELENNGAILRFLGRHPVALTLLGLLLVMAVSLRSMLIASSVSGGGMAVFPAAASEFFAEFRAAFHEAGLGSSAPASPALPLLGLWTVLALGKGILAQKLLLLLALPLAFATCLRALRLLVPDWLPRLVAALLYAVSPLATGALGQGRVGELVFLVLAPPALAQVAQGFHREQPREAWRPAVRFCLLAAVSIALYPPAVVVLGLVVLGALVAVVLRAAPADRAQIARQGGLLLAGLVGAVVLLWPWSPQLLGSASPLRGVGQPLAQPSVADLLQLRPGGPSVPSALVGPAYPLLALAALALAPAGRRLAAFMLVIGMALAALLAAWQGSGMPLRFTAWPGGVMIAGAVAWAGAAAIALDELPGLLSDRRVWWRALAAGLAVLVATTGLVALGFLIRGRWEPLGPVRQEALPATVTQADVPARVLWLQGRDDGGVDVAVTGPDGRSLLDPGHALSGPAAGALRSVVVDIVQARTHRAGALLAPFNIGYVAVRHGPQADRLAELIARQQDLELKPSTQRALFKGPGGSPRGLLWPGEPPARVQDLLRTAPQGQPVEQAQPQPLPAEVRGPATIVLPYPADGGWEVSVGGTQLAPSTALGWAQAFRVPEGTSGQVTVRRNDQRRRDLTLAVELVLVLVAVGAALRPTKAAPPPPPVAVEETTGDLRLAGLVQGGVR